MKRGRPQAQIDHRKLIAMLCEARSTEEICAELRICRWTLSDRISKLKAQGAIRAVGVRTIYEEESCRSSS